MREAVLYRWANFNDVLRHAVLFSNTVDLGCEPGAGVAVQVHTWIHGMVHLCGNREDERWPPMDEQLEALNRARTPRGLTPADQRRPI